MKTTLSIAQFDRLLARHGADLNAWTADTAEAAKHLLEHSGEARALLQQHRELSVLLRNMPQPSMPELESRVLGQALPARRQSVPQRFIDWLLPERGFSLQLWRPVTAACLPLVFGIVVGNYFSFGVVDPEQSFQDWDDELTLLSFNDLADLSETSTQP